jgi:hypothetical protein
MSNCKIKRNLVAGSGNSNSGNTVVSDNKVSSELNDKLKAMMAEREKQDKAFSNSALTEKEYEEKYGKQPGSNSSAK